MARFWLTCSRCDAQTEFRLSARCACGGSLLVEYDLDRVAATLSPGVLRGRHGSLWRYREMLPVERDESIVSLGEGSTPLLPLDAVARELGIRRLHVKHEEQNPTGSFKARGFSVAVSLLVEHGIRKAAVGSNGNAASALAAYAARAGIAAHVFLPRDCPGLIVDECRSYGAETFLVRGLIQDAGRLIDAGRDDEGWTSVGTLREPGRAEGKKTMGLELAEQLGWRFPDVIVYPTGGGSGIIGMWKAFRELRALGWVSGDVPRFACVQEHGCTPLLPAITGDDGAGAAADEVRPTPTGLRVPSPPDGPLVSRIVRESEGTAVSVTREEITAAQARLGTAGVSSSPEGAATLAGLERLRESGWVRQTDEVVLFNTAHALKYRPWTPSAPVPVVGDYADYRAQVDARRQVPALRIAVPA
ncbi:threonine synthase [Longimicrobium sp.]|uniref:threonine synthase n=1 Tax=Longimicrobium sp. TaxID=2029185 RepID=UPI002E379302|nr:threonine synthase [Longimicrobium sp.]HEX6038764.1 threonine synthase [Longimicrobium sp.]